MMDGMDDLVQFLRARLEEDARDAIQAGGKAWAWEQHHGDMCNDPTCPYGELATDDTVLMSVHGYDVKEGWSGAAHIARHNPARVLRRVEADRQIVRRHDRAVLRAGGGAQHFATETVCRSCEPNLQFPELSWPCPTLRLLALPYADHDDYRPEWRP